MATITYDDFVNRYPMAKVGLQSVDVGQTKVTPTGIFIESQEQQVSGIKIYTRDVIAAADCSQFDDKTELEFGFEVSDDGLTWIEKGPSARRASILASENGGEEMWQYWHNTYFIRELQPFSGWIRPFMRTTRPGKTIHIPNLAIWISA